MLGILLTVLRIIGIILLSILGLGLLLIIIVLFVPVRYKVKGSYGPPYFKARASYLLNIIVISAEYKDKLIYKLRVFGFPLFSSEKKQKTKSEAKTVKKNKGQSQSKEHISDTDAKTESTDNNNSINKQEAEHNIKNNAQESSVISNASEPENTSKAQYENNQDDNKENKDRLIDKLKDVKNNFDYYEKLLNNPSTQAAIALCKDRIGRLLKAVLPRKGYLNLDIGLENAGYTGKIMGAYYALYAYIGRVVHITPYYDKQIIQLDLYFKGHIRVVTLLYQLIRIYFDKDCHRLIKKMIKKAKAGKD